MLKVGDKVFCKKNFSYKDENKSYENRWFEIYSSYKPEDGQLNFDIGIKIDNDLYGFTSNRRYNIHRYFYDYFYTKEEIRELKLERLKC